MARLSFASDNNAGVHPRVLEAIARVNELPSAPAYGADEVSARATQKIAALFGGATTQALLMVNGTGANVVACASFLKPWEAVIAPASAHLHVDECGAFERFSGNKLISVETPDGKLTPAHIAPYLAWQGDVHRAQVRVISISQPNELGQLYSRDEIRALADFAHAHGMFLHMDGARFANAVAALGVTPAAITADVGVDALSFGGTKNGLLAGEAIVYFDQPDAARAGEFLRKQGLQLLSKARYLAAQFEAYLDGDLWLANARHANAMAARLAQGMGGQPGLQLAHPAQTNALFVRLERAFSDRLLERFYFYPWQMDEDGKSGIYRWMTSFQTTENEVDTLLSALREGAPPPSQAE